MGNVYNMTVPGTHSYLAELVGSHNCEPFGLSPVESMLCSTPVISWDSGAMRETIEHGKTGFLVKSEKELVDLLKTDAVARIDRGYCREWAKRFSVENMVDRVEELCYEAVETGGW
jgi:glycosyltransferase involved in cell wall biosynthesis